MADWIDSKELMDLLLPFCELKILDDERVKAIMKEAGIDPNEYNREEIEKHLNKTMKLKVGKTKKKEG